MLTRGVFLERTVANGAKRSGAQREEGGLEFCFVFRCCCVVVVVFLVMHVVRLICTSVFMPGGMCQDVTTLE